jgi:hypothetical protein
LMVLIAAEPTFSAIFVLNVLAMVIFVLHDSIAFQNIRIVCFFILYINVSAI